MRAIGLEGDQRAHPLAGARRGEVRLAHAEAREVLGGHVDAAVREVLGHVLAVLGQLQRRADRVRQRDPALVAHAEDRQHQLADGVGRQRAVAAQLLPAPIGRRALVEPVCVDQAHERLARERVASQRGRQRDEQRVRGGAREGAVELGFGPVERLQTVALVGVAELVDEPREAVDRDQAGALLACQQPARDREVLRARARQDGCRGGGVGGRRSRRHQGRG